MNLRHVMIDLETMGTTPNAAIVSIGAVIFDPRYNIVSKDTFYTELDWRNQGRHFEPSTREWWSKQSVIAKQVLHRGTISLPDALEDLTFWLPDDVRVWGNGPTFDISIPEDAFRQHKIDIPWKHWNIRDMRTAKDMFESQRGGLPMPKLNNNHNALQDAINQAQAVCKMWQKLVK